MTRCTSLLSGLFIVSVMIGCGGDTGSDSSHGGVAEPNGSAGGTRAASTGTPALSTSSSSNRVDEKTTSSLGGGTAMGGSSAKANQGGAALGGATLGGATGGTGGTSATLSTASTSAVGGAPIIDFSKGADSPCLDGEPGCIICPTCDDLRTAELVTVCKRVQACYSEDCGITGPGMVGNLSCETDKCQTLAQGLRETTDPALDFENAFVAAYVVFRCIGHEVGITLE